tara:strand:- start:132 stop:275 length:144 start_codon:yes stop_codon:yes gene_type:complete
MLIWIHQVALSTDLLSDFNTYKLELWISRPELTLNGNFFCHFLEINF